MDGQGTVPYDYEPSVKERHRSKASLTRGLVKMSAELRSI